MKKALSKQIEIPEGVSIEIKGNEIKISGPEGSTEKKFDIGKLDFKVEGKTIVIGNEKSTKVEKKMMNTMTAHINNMIKGVQKKFEYKLKICSGHFPMTVKVEGNKAIIKNFLGEKVDRTCTIPKGAEVNVQKDIITITSVDKEVAGQAAANFETATKVRNRDRRVFQDGIYIIEKDSKAI